MAGISSAGGELRLPIGQSPKSTRPVINQELQPVYNALHIANEYLSALRAELEGNDSQDPSVSMRFRFKFKSTAAVAISVGNIVCVSGNYVYKGVGSTGARVGAWTQSGGDGWNRSRAELGVAPTHFYVALTAAAAGQEIEVGVGPGVINVPGLACGQLIWGKDWRDIRAGRDANTNLNQLVSQNILNDGNLYTSNIIRTLSFTGGYYQSEGQLIGAGANPNWFGGLDYYTFFAFLHPVGIVIKNNYLLLFDYKYAPSPTYLVRT